MAFKQRVLAAEGPTWTVLGADYRVVAPVERYLEFLRSSKTSPNTVKAYAKGLELWTTFLEGRRQRWDQVGVADLGTFAGQVRGGIVGAAAVPIESRVLADSTVAVRVRAVTSFYRFHAASGVGVGEGLFETVRTRPGPYLPFLEHVARRDGRRRGHVRVRVRRRAVPVLLPPQMTAVRKAEAEFDLDRRAWVGELRYRLLWTVLEETGLRLGEALALQHRDWHTGTGSTADRTKQAETKARGAVKKLAGRNQPITFVSVSREAAVSTDFLYRHADLRAQIERHRARHSHRAPEPPPQDGAANTSSAVRALARRLDEERRAHRAALAQLQRALEVAQGENLELRRRLATYEPD